MADKDYRSHITHDDLMNLRKGTVASGPTFSQPMPPTMVQLIVIEVISDPVMVVNDKKKHYWKGVLNVSNMKYADILPRNTIIAQEFAGGRSPLFCFPFFPSHLSLPSKAGEIVWAVHHNPNADFSDMIYWMCKVTQPHFVDDVNHTHMPRLHEPSYTPDSITKSKKDGKADAWNELRNGHVQVAKIDGKSVRLTSQEQKYIISDKDDIFERIATETDAGAMTQYEAVPRFKKRPGDLALEGSNNSLIVLGTDRSGPAAVYTEQDNKFLIDNVAEDAFKKSPRPTLPTDDLQQSAGSIDLVVGRGQTIETFGSQTSTTRLKDAKNDVRGSELKKELDKVNDISIEEGDLDYANDRSRILISQRTLVDHKFNLSDYNSKFKDPAVRDSSSGESAVVIKSDKVRIIARSDVQIVVVGAKETKSPAGQTILKDDASTNKWASITVKTSGDIVFAPSDNGYIKLGSDKANKALLCTDMPAAARSGKVSAPAISDTAAGHIGTGAKGQGTWAKKILVD